MGGTFDMPSAQLTGASTTRLRVWNGLVGERGGCTLLGPEGPGLRIPSFWAFPGFRGCGGVGGAPPVL
jgi:hypothetical protein